MKGKVIGVVICERYVRRDKKQRCRVSAEETWGEALGTGRMN